jgi:hypothetical protein
MEDLPLEIIKKIFDFLPIHDRLICRHVCYDWKIFLDRRCLWDDICIYSAINLSDKYKCIWLSKNTRVFDNINKIKIITTNGIIRENVDLKWILLKYFSVNNRIYIDEHFASSLFKQCIRYGRIEYIKMIDKLIRNIHPELIEECKITILDEIKNGDFMSGSDETAAWIIKKYLSNENYICGTSRLFCKLMGRRFYKSAGLIIKHCQKHLVLLLSSKKILRNIHNQSMIYKYIELLKLREPGNETAFINLILSGRVYNFRYFWEYTHILSHDMSKINLIRTAKIAHAIIENASKFKQIKWAVRNFDDVLQIIGRNDREVREYSREVREIPVFIGLIDLPKSSTKLLKQIPYYIRASYPRWIDHIIKTAIFKGYHNDEKIHEWIKISKCYPSGVYEAVIRAIKSN